MTQEYEKIITLLHKANEKLQYPRIRMRHGFTLQLAGANSKFPKSINITDGKPYGSNKWFGRISTGGTLSMPNHMQEYAEELQTELGLFMVNPAKYAKGVSALSGSCMFCRKTLNHPQSVSVGYGPICAANYGMPWGSIDPEEAKRQASLEFDLPNDDTATFTETGKVEVVGKVGDYNEGKTLCDCGKFPPNMECNCDKIKTPDAISINHLHEVAIIQLSDIKHEQLSELIRINPEDEYMLLVIHLWESL